MMTVQDFNKIIRGSMSYEFEGTVLTVTGYFTGKRVSIDLGALDDEMFEQLVVEDEDDEYEDEEEDEE